MDQQKLRTLVFEKTGIRIDVTDPVFALVALNESVLEETLQRHWNLLREQVPGQWHAPSGASLPQPGTRQPAFKAGGDDFESEQEAVQSAPAASHDGHTPAPATAQESAAAPPLSAAVQQHTPHPPTTPHLPTNARLLWLVLAIPLLTALLVLAGQAWLVPHRSPAQSPAQLSSEQKAQLQRAEKLSRAIEKLDARSKAQLQAELDKL